LVDAPAGGEMQASYGGHAVDCGIIAHAINARPFFGAEVQVVSLVTGSDIERGCMPALRVIELHGEDIEVGGEMRKRAIFDPRLVADGTVAAGAAAVPVVADELRVQVEVSVTDDHMFSVGGHLDYA